MVRQERKQAHNIVYAIMLPKRSHYAYTNRYQSCRTTQHNDNNIIDVDRFKKSEKIINDFEEIF